MRLSRCAALTMAGALALAVPISGSATPPISGYVAAKAGAWIPTMNPGWSVGDREGPLPPSGDVEIAVGLREGLYGFQVAAGYTWSAVSGVAGLSSFEVTTSSVPFYALGQLRFPISIVEPYLEGGLGGFATFGTFRTTGAGAPGTASADGLSILAILGGGVDVVLDRLLVGVEVRQNLVLAETHAWGTLHPSALSVTVNVGYSLF